MNTYQIGCIITFIVTFIVVGGVDCFVLFAPDKDVKFNERVNMAIKLSVVGSVSFMGFGMLLSSLIAYGW